MKIDKIDKTDKIDKIKKEIEERKKLHLNLLTKLAKGEKDEKDFSVKEFIYKLLVKEFGIRLNKNPKIRINLKKNYIMNELMNYFMK